MHFIIEQPKYWNLAVFLVQTNYCIWNDIVDLPDCTGRLYALKFQGINLVNKPVKCIQELSSIIMLVFCFIPSSHSILIQLIYVKGAIFWVSAVMPQMSV